MKQPTIGTRPAVQSRHVPPSSARAAIARVTSLLVLATVALLISSVAAAQGATGVKGYLLGQLDVLNSGAAALRSGAWAYYEAASAADFDYEALASGNAEAARAALTTARTGWLTASPAYESVEGIVAGVELMAQFDVDLDAGLSAAEGPDDVVSFDLTLPDGSVLEKPGNLFGVTESGLWGTFPEFSSGVAFDVEGDGVIGFGDALPDANVLWPPATPWSRWLRTSPPQPTPGKRRLPTSSALWSATYLPSPRSSSAAGASRASCWATPPPCATSA